jgi:hypothetical protein
LILGVVAILFAVAPQTVVRAIRRVAVAASTSSSSQNSSPSHHKPLSGNPEHRRITAIVRLIAEFLAVAVQAVIRAIRAFW